jgi:hypothetical protein
MKFSCSRHYASVFSGILREGKTPNNSAVARNFTGLLKL